MALMCGRVCLAVVFVLSVTSGQVDPAESSPEVATRIAGLGSDDETARVKAVDALVGLGPRAVGTLVQSLDDPGMQVRREAAATLGRIGPDAAAAIGALTRVLREDGHDAVRQAAAMALASIGPDAIASLTRSLDHENAQVRRAAVSALRAMGPGARPALATLIEALTHADHEVRLGAAATLGCMGAEAQSAVAVLERMLAAGGSDEEIWAATGALARFGPVAVPALTTALDLDDARARSAAAAALAATGPPGLRVLAQRLRPADIPALVEAFRAKDPQFPWWVSQAMETIGQPAVPALAQAISQGDGNVQRAVIAALIRMDQRAKEAAVAELIRVLKDEDEDEEVRRRAIYGLMRIRPPAKAAIPALLHIVNTAKKVQMCHTAIRALAVFGPDAEPATGDVIAALKREHFTVTKMAARTLGRIGPAAIPAVMAGLGHEHPEVRRGCAMALVEMNVDVVPLLLEILEGDDPLARASAVDALGRLGAQASRAVPAVEKILDDDHEEDRLRDRAHWALPRIARQLRSSAAQPLDPQDAPATGSDRPPARGPQDRLEAFPGAEGFGAFSVGGRGGSIMMVTNLNDSGPGSLRAACAAAGRRIVVFRVSGVIELKNRLDIREPFLTIAGQTAPGGGVCIKDQCVRIVNTHDVVIRHLRIRSGDLSRDAHDAMHVVNSHDVIIDHCSLGWGTDETVSSARDLGVTIQWCMITEGLPDGTHPESTHGKGSLFTGDRGGISLHHCLYAHHERRSPRTGADSEDDPGIVFDCRNNVIYNWGNASGQSTVCPVKINYVGNYLKPGPSTWREARGIAFTPGGALTRLFLAENVIEGFPEKDQDNWRMVDYERGGSEAEVRVDEPFAAPPVCTESARAAYERVLAHAGATLPARDAVDARIVEDVRRGRGEIIDSQTWVGGWPYYRQGPPPQDTDGDGMPDAWERAHALDPVDPCDSNRDDDADGYTNVEEYLNATDPKALEEGAAARRGPGDRRAGAIPLLTEKHQPVRVLPRHPSLAFPPGAGPAGIAGRRPPKPARPLSSEARPRPAACVEPPRGTPTPDPKGQPSATAWSTRSWIHASLLPSLGRRTHGEL